ncbi:Major facilitator superfamily domain, general substrate transporter [Penicillium griseofulvum]|uniref:Major facilitator superfamily domain, general substrate transporter n=1 Tax=Penicillium patulum TaxID=5078 RepID=A0A135LF93_PENPA|nr:Major facilitator superfamily domain, general substrate transporter [Penicillium griseofulvum]KXG47634.1 Major facilitator superfamily domain, general substrate transporter [Penicillium griseofulvum]
MELDYTLDHNVTSPSDINLAPDILQTLLEADEFVTKYDLADIREVIRKGALLFHHPDDLKRIEEETLYLGNGNIQGKPPGSRVSQGVCHAAGFLSALLAVLPPQIFDPHPDDDWSYHRGSEGLWFWEYPKTFWEAVLLSSIAPLISAVLGFWLSLILNRYGGRRRGFSMGAVLALVAIFGQFISQDWHLHLVVDVLCVTALTILTCTIFLYIIEISETSRRASAFARWYS